MEGAVRGGFDSYTENICLVSAHDDMQN